MINLSIKIWKTGKWQTLKKKKKNSNYSKTHHLIPSVNSQ